MAELSNIFRIACYNLFEFRFYSWSEKEQKFRLLAEW